jgi:conjugative transfer region lipoprotein (TIGR03751 family)
MTRRHLVLLLVLWTSLIGCASGKDSILQPDGATMKAIYTRHFADIGLQGPASVRRHVALRPIHDKAADLGGFTRDAFNELDLHFPRLPNPTLVLYVYPHLAGSSRVPVPGYATSFPLYERVEYALPGEVSAGDQRSDPAADE